MDFRTLNVLRLEANEKRFAFEALVPAKFPGLNHWHWHRALAAIRGENVRRNDDQSQDAALAADSEIKAASDSYLTALHAYYRARDGENGFLGVKS